MTRISILLLLTVSIAACAPDTGPTPPTGAGDARTATSILVFGDTGYDYNYLDADDYEDKFTGREFIIHELDDWIEDNRPIEEFELPPMHLAEQTGGYVMASGLEPTAKAIESWCAPEERCNFAVMLGDNIYPAGATLGKDGHDDQKRFDDLLYQPYKRLKDQDAGFVIYPVLGNHDWETSREGALLQVEFLEKSPLYHMDGVFYRVRPQPDVEIFAIDTSVLLAGETVYEDAVAPDGTPLATGELESEGAWIAPVGDEQNMVTWLEAALRESDARWKLVIGHHPLWSSSGTKQEQAKVLQRVLKPALCRYADAYLVGHDHMIEVHTDDCRAAGIARDAAAPLLEVVSGAAGKQRPLHRPFMQWQEREFPELSTFYSEGLVWGFAELVLDGDTATVHVVTTPDSGNGDAVEAYSHSFARRSGDLAAAAK